jgi:hypothetical protein
MAALGLDRAASQQNLYTSALGTFATTQDKVTTASVNFQKAQAQDPRLTNAMRDKIKNEVAAWDEWNNATKKAQAGQFDLTEATRATGLQLQDWINHKLLDPNNPTQYAAAITVLAKQTEQLGESAQIAGSKFEQLKRYQLDAANGRTTFDKFATSTLDTVTNGFADAITRVKSFKDAVKDMTRSVLSDLVKIALRSAITGPAAGMLGSLASSFGGGSVNANGSIAGAFGATSVGGAPLVGFARGTTNAPGGLAMVNEKGGEIIDLPSGARVIPHDVSMHMASQGGGVTMGDTNIIIHGNADDKALFAMQRELASHRQQISAQFKQSQSQAHYTSTGVS